MAEPGDSIVIVGCGLAAARAAHGLRSRGHVGLITMLGEEAYPAYDRPPLSKEVLATGADRPELPMDWADLGVELRLGVRATGLDCHDDGVRISTNEVGAVDAAFAIIATGAAPRSLPGSDAHGEVITLRTWDDAAALRAACRPDARVIVIGAGWIGAEVATSAAQLGCRVTVVEALPTPMAALLGPRLGATVAAWYSDAGVELLTGTSVTGFAPGAVELADRTVPADVVVVGIGVVPATGWLRGSDLQLGADGAVVVDEFLRTSAPRVWAAGDCAAHRSPRYGRLMRSEHWTNAQLASAAAAANLTGEPTAHDPVPYFWSNQFGRMVQYCGQHSADDALVMRGDPAEPKWAACWVDGNRLTAVLTVDRPGDSIVARKFIDANTSVEAAKLADASVPLRSCAGPADPHV